MTDATSLSYRQVNGYTVITTGPELDVYTAHQFRDLVNEMVTAGHCDLIADLTNTEFVDSTGLGILVGALRRTIGAGGSFQAVSGHEQFRRMARTTGLARVLTIRETVDEATRQAPGQRQAATLRG
jgi:anti-sigma B factor antagonist